MDRSYGVKALSAVLVALIVSTPVYADCTRCCNVYSPPVCEQLLYDNYFNEGCAWVFEGDTQVASGTAELYGFGTVEQTVTVPSGDTTTELRFDVDVIPGTSSGTERLSIAIVTSGSYVLDEITPSDSDGTYTYYPGDYHGQTITVRFRYRIGVDPGDTVFRVDNVTLFSC